CSKGLYFWQDALQTAQFDVAVGAPATAVERDDYRPHRQKAVKPNWSTVGVHENEIPRTLSFFECRGFDAACYQFLCGTVHYFELLSWDHVVPVVMPSLIKFGCRLQSIGRHKSL